MHRIYNIKAHKRVEKFFSTHSDVARKAIGIFRVIREDPFSQNLSYDIKPYLGAGKDHFRLRIGKYRLLYQVREEDILIYLYDADSRGQIYK